MQVLKFSHIHKSCFDLFECFIGNWKKGHRDIIFLGACTKINPRLSTFIAPYEGGLFAFNIKINIYLISARQKFQPQPQKDEHHRSYLTGNFLTFLLNTLPHLKILWHLIHYLVWKYYEANRNVMNYCQLKYAGVAN